MTIYGPSVIRDYTVIDAHSSIERSILWRNNYVGENCELRAPSSAANAASNPTSSFSKAVIGDKIAAPG